jgi:hypothetical protein
MCAVSFVLRPNLTSVQATRWDNYLRIFDPKIRKSYPGRLSVTRANFSSRLVQSDQFHILCCIPLCYGFDDPSESRLSRCKQFLFPTLSALFDHYQISRYNAMDLSVSMVPPHILPHLTFFRRTSKKILVGSWSTGRFSGLRGIR